MFKKHFFPFDFLALTSQSIVGESLTEFRPKDEVNTGWVRCIFGENVLKQKNIFITTKKLTLHFSPFNCCISVVLKLKKGHNPNICMLCFATLNKHSF